MPRVEGVAETRAAYTPHADTPLLSPPVTRPRRFERRMWTAIALLTIVGLATVIARLTVVTTMLATPADQRPEISAFDQRNVTMLAAAARVAPGSPLYNGARNDVIRVGNAYVQHAGYGLLHFVPGVIVLLLAPLQFSRRIRARHRALHRWSGRTILICSIGIVISGVFFGIVESAIHPLERWTIAVIMSYFVLSAVRGYTAVRRGEIERHREWMLRCYATIIGVATVRVVALPLGPFFPQLGLSFAVMLSWWIGWLLTIGTAELWIRYSRRTGIAAEAVAA